MIFGTVHALAQNIMQIFTGFWDSVYIHIAQERPNRDIIRQVHKPKSSISNNGSVDAYNIAVVMEK